MFAELITTLQKINYIDPKNTDEMAKAVSGLSGRYQAMALNLKGLSEVETKNILATNGLTGGFQAEALSATSLSYALSRVNTEHIKAVMSSNAMITQTTKEIIVEQLSQATNEKGIVVNKKKAAQIVRTNLATQGLTAAEIQTQLVNMGLAGSNGILTASFTALAASIKATAIELVTIAARHPLISAIVVTIALLIGALVKAKKEQEALEKKQEESRQQAIENANAYREECEALKSLTDEYTKLSEQAELTADDKTRLLEIQDELVDKYGIEANKIDLLNGKYEDNIALLKERRREALKNDYINQIGATNAYDVYATDNISNVRTYSDFSDKNFVELGEILESFENIAGVTVTKNEIPEWARANNTYAYGNSYEAMASGFEINAVSSAEKVEALREMLDVLIAQGWQDTELFSDISSLYAHYSEEADNLRKSVESVANTVFEMYSLDNPTDSLGLDSFEVWVNGLHQMPEYANATDSVREAIDRLALSVIDSSTKFDSYSEAVSKCIANLNEFETSAEELTADINDTQEAMSDLFSLYEKSQSGTALSSKELIDIYQQFPQYYDEISAGITKTTDGYVLERNAIEQLYKTHLETEKQRLQVSLDSAKAKISDSMAIIEACGLEVQALNEVERAEKELSKVRLMESIASIESSMMSAGAATRQVYGQLLNELRLLQAELDFNDQLSNVEMFEEMARALQAQIDALGVSFVDTSSSSASAVNTLDQAIADEISYLNDLRDTYLTYIEDWKEDLLAPINARIEALQTENDEIEKTNELLEAQKALEDALQRRRYVYRKGEGFVYEQDDNEVKEAQDNLTKVQNNQEIEKLEAQIEEIEKQAQERTDEINEAFEQSEEVLNANKSDYEQPAHNESLWQQIKDTEMTQSILNGENIIKIGEETFTLGMPTQLQELFEKMNANIENFVGLPSGTLNAMNTPSVGAINNTSQTNNIEVHIEVAGNADAGTVTEIRQAVDGAFAQIASQLLNIGIQSDYKNSRIKDTQ